MGSKKTGKWLAALRDDDPVMRREAARKLGRRGNREAVRPLCDALQDENWRVRSNAARSLGIIGDPWAVEPLIAALDDRMTTVRREAARALGSIRDIHAVHALCNALGDRKASVRENATFALQQMGVAIVPALCQHLDDSNALVRYHATLALCALYESERRTVTDRILTDRHLTPRQRWQGLEAIRAARPSRFSLGWIRDVHQFCQEIQRQAEAEGRTDRAVYRGALQVLEYITLARPVQRDFVAERESLLRAAQAYSPDADAADTLLRGAQREEAPGTPGTARRAGLWASLLARLRGSP
ncbi:MAG: HEAT repeat domain-containing protein [Chloroherpetonaceae bacterium]|nr:HEAT repeat domain-containing protein [Chthonomonadaceae bacterium]MDW8208557.1 HEAT repeat domain-containing protein [Chloroherpetonaceae bacterium]